MLGLHIAANEEARASDRSYAYARGRSAYFRNHLTTERRAYFRLAGQLSQLCAQTLHIFAYYPRTSLSRSEHSLSRRLCGGVCVCALPRPPVCMCGVRAPLVSRVRVCVTTVT